MKKIPSIENGMRTPTFEKKSQTQIFFFFFFGCFCRRFCHADVDSRAQQAILLIKAENFRPKLFFPVFPAKKLARFCHTVLDFREHQGSRAPSRLSRPRPIECDREPKQTVKIFPVFGQFFFRTSSIFFFKWFPI